MPLIVGVALGILTALPFAVALRHRGAGGIAGGVAAVLASFGIAHVGLIAVWRLMPDALLPCVAIVAITLLATVTASSLRRL